MSTTAPARATSSVVVHRRRNASRARVARRVDVVPAAAAADANDAPSRKKVSMVSLGCPKNTVDGEVILGDLHANGFEITDDHEAADAIIINSCGFVEDAKNESVEAILEAAKLRTESGRSDTKIIVTGCLAQRYANDLANELPEADVIVGFENYGNLPRTVGGGARRRGDAGGVVAAAGAGAGGWGEPAVQRGDETVENHAEALRVSSRGGGMRS